MACAYGLYVVWRLKEREPVPMDERENFGMKTAQMPNASIITDPEGGITPETKLP
ncbi:hypothetical protein D3C86_2146010 [compost metagenome]